MYRGMNRKEFEQKRKKRNQNLSEIYFKLIKGRECSEKRQAKTSNSRFSDQNIDIRLPESKDQQEFSLIEEIFD